MSLSVLMLLFNQNIKNNYITMFSLLTQWMKSLFTFLLVCYLQYILYHETLGLFEPVIILWKCWEQQETKPHSLFINRRKCTIHFFSYLCHLRMYSIIGFPFFQDPCRKLFLIQSYFCFMLHLSRKGNNLMVNVKL